MAGKLKDMTISFKGLPLRPIKSVTGLLANNMEYAQHLQYDDLEPYYVIDPDHLVETWNQMSKAFSKEAPMDMVVHLALAQTIRTEIAFLQSYTSETRPPRKKGEGQRQAHPGHWGDVEVNLVNEYAGDVSGTAI